MPELGGWVADCVSFRFERNIYAMMDSGVWKQSWWLAGMTSLTFLRARGEIEVLWVAQSGYQKFGGT